MRTGRWRQTPRSERWSFGSGMVGDSLRHDYLASRVSTAIHKTSHLQKGFAHAGTGAIGAHFHDHNSASRGDDRVAPTAGTRTHVGVTTNVRRDCLAIPANIPPFPYHRVKKGAHLQHHRRHVRLEPVRANGSSLEQKKNDDDEQQEEADGGQPDDGPAAIAFVERSVPGRWFYRLIAPL